MGFNKNDAKMTKGLAILCMVILHLFQRLSDLPYTPLLYIGGNPFVYYLGLLADATVPTYCFCMGYSHFLSGKKDENNLLKNNVRRLLPFMINYWLIVIIISIAGLAIHSQPVPKSLPIFLGNFFTILNTYNGAWWFVKTYIIFILLSSILYKVTKKMNFIVLTGVTFILYTGSYLLRFSGFVTNISLIDWCVDVIGRFGTSLFPYILGMIFCKHDVFTLIKDKFKAKRFVSFIVFAIITVGCFVVHIVLKPLYFSVFFAIALIIGFNFWQKPKFINKTFEFLGDHSTNIWLVHMFFYLHPFNNFVFIAKYPILILILMLAICIVCSYILKLLNKPFDKLLAKRSI